MSSALLATLWLAARLASLQATPPPPVPSSAAAPLVPGQLPADTSAEARAAWTALCNATSGANAQQAVLGFQIRFDGRARPVGRESHDFDDARYRYLEPGWIHMALKDGTVRLRGPQGDYFVKDGVATRLQGRDFENDRREIDEQVRVAHSFVSLIDVRTLRLSSLRLAAQAPPFLPESMAARGRELRWLELLSPDFDDYAATGAAQPALVRAWIGTDATTHLPQLALVARDDHGALVHETAQLIKLDEWKPLDGFQVPRQVRSFAPDLSRSPWVFAETPVLTLWLKEGTLRPTLTEQDFVPPQTR